MEYRPPRSAGNPAGSFRQAGARRATGPDRPPPGHRPVDQGGQPRRAANRSADARRQPHPDRRHADDLARGPLPEERYGDPVRTARPVPRKRARPALVGAKVVLAAVSMLVLSATGYYWAQLNNWSEGMTTTDVIASAPTEKPADGAIDILMVGMDSRTDAQGHPLSKEQLHMLNAGKADGALNTDTLILIRIPNDGGRAVGVSMPRDSYVDIPDYGTHKINSAYLRAKNTAMERLRQEGVSEQAELEVRSNQEGAKNLIATVQDLTGATIDHYAEVNLLGFYDITNAVGGIDVCLNKAVKDKYSGANFAKGPQKLAGAQALAFVRQRHGLPNGDLDRIVRQQVFMSGMAKKVFSREMLTPGSETLDKLRLAVQKSVVLDKDWNVIEFAQQMVGFTGGKLEFETIPVGSLDLDTPEDGSAVEVDPMEVREFVRALLGGPPPASGTGEPTEQSAGNSRITVDVRNASGRTGLAGQVSDTLAEQGFQAGETGNASRRANTVIRFPTGEQDNGQRVAEALGGDLRVEPDSNVTKGHITVLLGTDFEEAGDQLTGRRMLSFAAGQPPPATDTKGCVN